jgi:hypothetical protein
MKKGDLTAESAEFAENPERTFSLREKTQRTPRSLRLSAVKKAFGSEVTHYFLRLDFRIFERFYCTDRARFTLRCRGQGEL